MDIHFPVLQKGWADCRQLPLEISSDFQLLLRQPVQLFPITPPFMSPIKRSAVLTFPSKRKTSAIRMASGDGVIGP